MTIEQVCQQNKCTGCFACRNICPKDAISVVIDIYGCTKPAINSDKCISCHLCEKTCPAINSSEKFCPDFCYAAWSQIQDDQIKSSSGGVGAVFARNIVQNGGVVFGAVSEQREVKHECIESIMDFEKLRGSKYVQSDIGLSFREVKESLKNRKKVLFIGTPCQIDGLKHYLGSIPDNLILVDLICHGVPPFNYLTEYLDGKSEWDRVSFRGNPDYTLVSHLNDVIKYQIKSSDDIYFKAFLDGLIYRENCYACQYASKMRVSDITIGDFWGLNRAKIESSYHGKVSVVLPNTKKGAEFIERCSNDLILTRLPIEDALNEKQGNLLHPTIPHKDRKDFLKYYPTLGFTGAIKKTDLYKEMSREKKILYRRKQVKSIIRRFAYFAIGEKYANKLKQIIRR